MIITLIKNNVELILCDGALRGVNKSAGPRGFTYTGQEQRQVAQFFRAKTARVFPRGNGLDEFRFSVLRECASTDEAALWLLTHRMALPKNDDPDTTPLTVEFWQGDAKVMLQNADVQLIGGRPVGLTLELEYDIVGGPLISQVVGIYTGDN